MMWASVTDKVIGEKIQAIVNEGASRLINPEQIEKDMLALIEERQASGASFVPWSAIDLGRGYCGFCVLFGILDKANPDDGWDLIGHTYMQEIQKIIMKDGISEFGLWSGLAGIVVAARSLSRNGQRYKHFMDELNTCFINSFPNMMAYMESKLEEGPSLHEFDVIQGMSGIGRYVLCFIEQQPMRQALEQILSYMVKLCEDRSYKGLDVPGWLVSYDRYYGHDREDYPNGHFNCGMSHGIPGVLALMAIALMKGVEVAGQREAMDKIAAWLMKWKEHDAYGPLWPARVSWEENQKGTLTYVVPREAWCYGSPGVARALWLSGTALHNHQWKELALETYRGTAMRPEEKWHIESDTFCHGRAGLLQMVQRMYAESGDELIGQLRDRLLGQVLERWQPDAPYGYQEKEDGAIQNIAGLLDGAAGVFTVLAGIMQEEDPEWDMIFLIS